MSSQPSTSKAPEQRRHSKDKDRAAEEKRKKHEYEKQKAAKKEQHEKAEAAKKEVGADQRLTRKTNFLCRIQFRNDLPEVPVEPKLLAVPTRWDRFVSYKSCANLDAMRSHDFLLEPELGIPLDLLEAQQYQVPHHRQRLDPEDEALLRSENNTVGGVIVNGRRVPTANIVSRSAGVARDFTWLMKTQYISDENAPKQAGISEKTMQEMRKRAAQEMSRDQEQDTLTSQIATIEASFKAAAPPPVHQTKPHLQPVEVLPVLPDFDRWPQNLVQVLFDVEPTQNISDVVGAVSEEDAKQLAAYSVIKSFSVPVEGSEPEKFAAYLVPSAEDGLPAIRRGALEEAEAVDYKWVREYHYEARPDEAVQDTMMFFFSEGQVGYTPLGTKLVLQKKKARGLQDKGVGVVQDISRPASVSVRKRAATGEELHQRRKVVRVLENPYGPEEEEEEEDDDEIREAGTQGLDEDVSE
uniref:RNA polymerase II-associated factor 1 homolog n=1 Tax=Pyramimonas obovata TaxID=1411642 RepID=A0A6T7YFR6_9CHLO|mmetsp:Transcript_39436/g.85797  ORF Transcript_39436/g.85797 Transcript_39436/m.85797 type:complete len:467 (-) Transcript_39436:490-1890(-)